MNILDINFLTLDRGVMVLQYLENWVVVLIIIVSRCDFSGSNYFVILNWLFDFFLIKNVVFCNFNLVVMVITNLELMKINGGDEDYAWQRKLLLFLMRVI